MLTENDITPSADEGEHGHGIPRADTIHAYRQSWTRLRTPDPEIVMVIGPDRTGSMLEVGVVVEDGEDVRIIHSMPCRAKWLPRQPSKKKGKRRP